MSQSMRLLVNTLSIGSMSGEHVVYGFLREWLSASGDPRDTVVLHCDSQLPPDDILQYGVQSRAVSDHLRSWTVRAAWESVRLPALLREMQIDRVLNVSGGIAPFLRVPQVSLAMNPWCYVKSARSGWRQEFKAWAQRRSYRYAFCHAAQMIYISKHLRDLYRSGNHDISKFEAPSTIAFVGLDQALFSAAQELSSLPRKPLSVLSVSAFARWKGVETVLHALRMLRERGLNITYTLVGPWPDSAYEADIRTLINQLQLEQCVNIEGKVSRSDLYHHYATHQAFCLMSNCESFGIPAAEAMAFGTPVVSTDCCAIAEVCSKAGLFVPYTDLRGTAAALERVLTDAAEWKTLSSAAREAAASLTWPRVSRSFVSAITAPAGSCAPAVPVDEGTR